MEGHWEEPGPHNLLEPNPQNEHRSKWRDMGTPMKDRKEIDKTEVINPLKGVLAPFITGFLGPLCTETISLGLYHPLLCGVHGPLLTTGRGPSCTTGIFAKGLSLCNQLLVSATQNNFESILTSSQEG